jgi:hypothetical protein
LRIHLTDPTLVPSLLEFLTGTVRCVAERVDENDIEVSLLGSYQPETHDHAVGLLVRAWEASREYPAD